MTAAKTRGRGAHALRRLQRTFLTILPRIVLHGRVCFCHLKCADRREDAIAEMVGLAWQWFLRLAQSGKDTTRFSATLARYAGRAVRSGRRLCGRERARDAMSSVAKQRHNFRISPLLAGNSLCGNVFDEALHDNTQTPVPDQVGFRVDFPCWRRSRCERDRRLIDDLMTGDSTFTAARRYGLSPARISQLRHEFMEDWLAFCGELVLPDSAPACSPDDANCRTAGSPMHKMATRTCCL
jgi:hypothetical protein